jgi:hypothetical protein
VAALAETVAAIVKDDHFQPQFVKNPQRFEPVRDIAGIAVKKKAG